MLACEMAVEGTVRIDPECAQTDPRHPELQKKEEEEEDYITYTTPKVVL